MKQKDALYKKALREKAEAIVANRNLDIDVSDKKEIKRIFFELCVNQVELEMQNEDLKIAQTSLLVAQRNINQFFELAPVGYVVLNNKAEILQCNRTIQEWLNHKPQAVEHNKNFENFIFSEDHSIFNAHYEAFYKFPENKRIELRLQRHSGSPLSVELTGRLVKPFTAQAPGNHDEGLYLLVNIIDISARKQLEKELRLAAKVFENSDEGIMITDHLVRIVKVNPAFTAVTGYHAEEVIGKSPSILKSHKQTPEFYKQMWNKIYRDGNWSGDIWNRRKNGNYYLEWLSITSIIDKHGKTTHYIGTFSDITYRKQAEQQVQIMAHYDTLTNLPNRILLNERLKHSIVRATRHNQWISVLSLNLDRFKTLNETLGHFIGDLLLQGVAQRLSECVGVSDTVARFGGDEFVIILSDFEDEQAAILHTKEIANHILSELVKPFDLLGNKFLTSTSIGFAFFPKHGRSVAELLKNSDNAMYFAKAMGRNNYQCYSGNMRVQAMARSCLANDLRLVLENRELVLYFQSIVNLHTLETVGFEVLVRWNHPKRGLLMPDQFIPIAEETGMINEIGRWALHTACQQLTVWHNAGKRVKIAVNLSAQQFFQHDLFTTIIDALESHNVPSEYLELDITEAIIMQNLNQAMRILKKLQQLGVKISLDDFGTGYSSLTYLKRLPINAIKIDRSFVKKLLNESRDQVIVDSIISIAEHMQLDIITEGIEQIEQVEYFKSKGIKFAQGYYFALPCIADECFLTNDKNNQHF